KCLDTRILERGTFISKAWENLSSTTIVNCFANASFQQHQPHNHFDEEDELSLT
ncbi:hypothetical protein ABEB36_014875, partial [Hypothenemus hampei]